MQSQNENLKIVLLTSAPQKDHVYTRLRNEIMVRYPNTITVAKIQDSYDNAVLKYGYVNVIGVSESARRNTKMEVVSRSLPRKILYLIVKIPRAALFKFPYARDLQREYRRLRRVNKKGRIYSLLAAPGKVVGFNYMVKMEMDISDARSIFNGTLLSESECDVFFPWNGDQAKLRDYLNSIKPDVLIQLGWGIVNKPLLEVECWGIISWHHGVLPYIRGGFTAVWPIIFNRPNWFGISLQKIRAGIDTGEIISIRQLDPRTQGSYIDAYLELDRHSIEMTLNALGGIARGEDIISDKNINCEGGIYRTVPGIFDLMRFIVRSKIIFTRKSTDKY